MVCNFIFFKSTETWKKNHKKSADLFNVINNTVICLTNCFFGLNIIPSRVFLLIADDIVLHIEIPRDDNCNLVVHILWLCVYKWPWMGSETHTNCLTLSASVCHVWKLFYWEQIPHRTSHTAFHSGSRWTTVSWLLFRAHSSRALVGSDTVDGPSSAGVINDFLWLIPNSPSIVDPLFPTEPPPLVHHHAIPVPPFGNVRCTRWINGLRVCYQRSRKRWQTKGGGDFTKTRQRFEELHIQKKKTHYQRHSCRWPITRNFNNAGSHRPKTPRWSDRKMWQKLKCNHVSATDFGAFIIYVSSNHSLLYWRHHREKETLCQAKNGVLFDLLQSPIILITLNKTEHMAKWTCTHTQITQCVYVCVSFREAALAHLPTPPSLWPKILPLFHHILYMPTGPSL